MAAEGTIMATNGTKKLTRERAARTGENYTTAKRAVYRNISQWETYREALCETDATYTDEHGVLNAWEVLATGVLPDVSAMLAAGAGDVVDVNVRDAIHSNVAADLLTVATGLLRPVEYLDEMPDDDLHVLSDLGHFENWLVATVAGDPEDTCGITIHVMQATVREMADEAAGFPELADAHRAWDDRDRILAEVLRAVECGCGADQLLEFLHGCEAGRQALDRLAERAQAAGYPVDESIWGP